MEKIPKAVEFLQNFTDEPNDDTVFKAMIEFAKMHVKAALEAALEEVPYGGSDEVRYEDVKGILTCYPEDLIK